MTRALAALAFVIAFSLTTLWLTDRNTAFCNTSGPTSALFCAA
jgi:hypothetical protein